jgi:hypothetical protein
MGVKYWLDEQTVYKFNVLVIFKNIFALRIWRIRKTKNEGKLSTSQLIMVHNGKIFYPVFLYQMFCIKPENHFTQLSL